MEMLNDRRPPSGIGPLTFYLALDDHSQNPGQTLDLLPQVQRE